MENLNCSDLKTSHRKAIHRIVRNIIGSQTKYPFYAKPKEFHELFQTVKISLISIYEDIFNNEIIIEYLLETYIKPRANKKIRNELKILAPHCITNRKKITHIKKKTKIESKVQSKLVIDPNCIPGNISKELIPKKDISTEDTSNENIPTEKDDSENRPIPERIQELLNIPQPEQKSQAWLDQRQNFITASVFGDACGLKGPVALVSLLLNKVSFGKYQPFNGNKATQWGEKYEDVANAIYCYRNQCRVFEFGMIAHSDHPFLGASTDGISDQMVNIEIKCPFSRFITGVTPKGYWAQTQLQMNVLNLERTHFLECRFWEYDDEESFFLDFEWLEDAGVPLKGDQITFLKPPPKGHHLEKGLIFEVIDLKQQNLAGDPKTIYMYSPIKYYRDKMALKAWREETLKNILSSDHLIYIRVIPWVLTRLSCVEIERDAVWFNEQIPKLTEFWKDVQFYRQQDLSLEQISLLKATLVDKYLNFGGSNKSSRKSSKKSSPNGMKQLKFSTLGCLLEDEEDVTSQLGGCLLDDSDDEFKKAIPNKFKMENKAKKPSRYGKCFLGDSDDEESNEVTFTPKQSPGNKKPINNNPKKNNYKTKEIIHLSVKPKTTQNIKKQPLGSKICLL